MITFGLMCYFTINYNRMAASVTGLVQFLTIVATQISMLYVLDTIGQNSMKVQVDLIDDYLDEDDE